MTSLNRITFHWTGGVYTPNNIDKHAYHFLIDGDGNVIKGDYRPEDNTNCLDGFYAKHCGGGNTGNIGIAICGMYSNDYPIKRVQIEAACKLAAQLTMRYGIRITNRNVITHAEFGRQYPHTTSNGKIDIINLPCVAVYGMNNVGNWIRNKVQWYRSKM
jgi:N-acetyl-anhydromuramyl-L-alanine amidase AmpD